MVHSARLIAKNPEQLGKLTRVFDTIEERATHLAAFLEGYARFARLPKPRVERVAWAPFLDGIRMLFPDLELGSVRQVNTFHGTTLASQQPSASASSGKAGRMYTDRLQPAHE